MRVLSGFLIAIFLVLVLMFGFGIYSFRHPTLDEPNPVEANLVNRFKLWLIPKDLAPAPPEKSEQAILNGGEHYNHHCAVCHDLHGDADSLFAESFFPRVSDLTSDFVQSYSDGQLKWVVDNGIRYSGMPGWAMLIDDEVQWNIVYYMRIMKDPQQMEHYAELLRQMGKGEIGVPADEHSHEAEEHVQEQSGGEEHEHQGHSLDENSGAQEVQPADSGN